MIKVYVLLLEGNNYYVGQTKDVDQRLKDHFKAKLGSEWTKKYKPIKIIEIKETQFEKMEDALSLENATTIEYMEKYGWKNVRGGDFCTLDDEKLRFLLTIKSDIKELLPDIKLTFDISEYDKLDCFFVLKLNGDNYFIGRTNNLKLAILNEYNGFGSEWTRINKPIELLEITKIEPSDKSKIRNLHNQYVISFMKKFGFQKIRGGDFYKVEARNHKNKVLNYTDIFK